MGLEIYAGDDLGPSLIFKIKLSPCLKGLVQFEKEQGCIRKKSQQIYPLLPSPLILICMYYSLCTQCADKVQQVHCLPSHP